MQLLKLAGFPQIYTIFICTWYLPCWQVGDGNCWLTLVNRVVPFLFTPVVVYIVLLLYSRQYKHLIVLLVPGLIFATLYHPYLIPKFARPVEHTVELKVMTEWSNSPYSYKYKSPATLNITFRTSI